MQAALDLIPAWLGKLPGALLVLALSVIGGKALGALLAKLVRRFASPGWDVMARRFGMWTLVGLGLANALQAMGVDLSVLLGAAGFFTVALGFASQTSASNFISGLFLMLENAVKVGDVIEVAGISGEVLSIDPLSVRLRTFDNRMVRVPNESLVKSSLTNLSGFPIRRIDLVLFVPQEADLSAARRALLTLAEGEAQVLQEPAPVVQIQAFEGGLAKLQYSVWAARDAWIGVRTELNIRIPGVLDQAGAPLGRPRVDVAPPPPTHAAAAPVSAR